MKRIVRWIRWLLNKDELEAQNRWLQMIHYDLQDIRDQLKRISGEPLNEAGALGPLGPVKMFVMQRPGDRR